uniref:Uncharacterized protein n=1 Tax=Anguilla anguilla TaxID=7936 RepID=A0A0E9Q8T3_ANGAN
MYFFILDIETHLCHWEPFLFLDYFCQNNCINNQILQ